MRPSTWAVRFTQPPRPPHCVHQFPTKAFALSERIDSPSVASHRSESPCSFWTGAQAVTLHSHCIILVSTRLPRGVCSFLTYKSALLMEGCWSLLKCTGSVCVYESGHCCTISRSPRELSTPVDSFLQLWPCLLWTLMSMTLVSSLNKWQTKAYRHLLSLYQFLNQPWNKLYLPVKCTN